MFSKKPIETTCNRCGMKAYFLPMEIGLFTDEIVISASIACLACYGIEPIEIGITTGLVNHVGEVEDMTDELAEEWRNFEAGL